MKYYESDGSLSEPQTDGSPAMTGWPYTDPVDHPAHYTKGSVECIDAIKSALTEDEFRGYLKGAAIKYIWRERHKGNGKQDLEKAQWYLKRIAK